jgi:hypothetical protein
MEQFQHLKQTTSVSAYIDAFEEYMINMQRDHPHLTDNFLLRFISSLKDTVKSHNSSTLKSAYWHARQQEQAYLSASKRPTYVVTNSRPSALPHNRQFNNFRDNRPRAPSEKPKERGKCWYCPEQWSFGHKCANMKKIVHAIQLQGHNDSEDSVELTDTYHDAQHTLPNTPLQPSTEDTAQTHQENQAKKLMQILVEAIHGIPGETTNSVLVTFLGCQAVAPIDSGSTYTFIDSTFVTKSKLPFLPTCAHIVLVVGGGELISDGHIPYYKFTINNREFHYTCKILPLKGYDMVLGANWLTTHSPNHFYWQKRAFLSQYKVNGAQ